MIVSSYWSRERGMRSIRIRRSSGAATIPTMARPLDDSCRSALRALGICLLLGGGAVCAAAEPPMLYRDAHASIEQRVQDLLSRMTLEEKVAQLRSMWQTKGSIEDTEGAFSEEKAHGAIPNGIGQMA